MRQRSPRDTLIIPLWIALTMMWLAAGFDVLYDKSNTGALEVFLATTTLEGMVVAYVVGVGRIRGISEDEHGDRR